MDKKLFDELTESMQQMGDFIKALGSTAPAGLQIGVGSVNRELYDHPEQKRLASYVLRKHRKALRALAES